MTEDEIRTRLLRTAGASYHVSDTPKDALAKMTVAVVLELKRIHAEAAEETARSLYGPRSSAR